MLAVVAEVARERRAAGQQRRRDVEPRVAPQLDVRPAAGVHDGRQPRRVGAGRPQRHVRGAGGDLRRPARLRRGLPPLRTRARRHARRAARPRPPDRSHRADRASGRPGRTGSSCCPTTARPRARRSSSAPARRSPSSSAGCAAGRRRATPTPRRGAPSRPPGCARRATRTSRRRPPSSPTRPIVLASGALGLISIPGETAAADPRGDRRPLSRRSIDGLVSHPEIGFVLVRSADGSLRRARRGRQPRPGTPARSTGDDPLAPFGPDAVDQVREVDGYRTVADLMVNSRYDPDLDEVAAFEHQVGSHGALGGPQTHPFVLHPADLSRAGRADPRLARRCTACSRAGWPTSATRSRPRGDDAAGRALRSRSTRRQRR